MGMFVFSVILGQKDSVATSFHPSYKQDILLHHESWGRFLFTWVTAGRMDSGPGVVM